MRNPEHQCSPVSRKNFTGNMKFHGNINMKPEESPEDRFCIAHYLESHSIYIKLRQVSYFLVKACNAIQLSSLIGIILQADFKQLFAQKS